METDSGISTKKSFVGTSKNGNCQEALEDAINIAQKSVGSEVVMWKLEEMYGEHGGFVNANNVSVKISVQDH